MKEHKLVERMHPALLTLAKEIHPWLVAHNLEIMNVTMTFQRGKPPVASTQTYTNHTFEFHFKDGSCSEEIVMGPRTPYENGPDECDCTPCDEFWDGVRAALEKKK